MSKKIVQMPKPKKEYFNNCKVANYISTKQGDLFSATLQLETIPKKSIVVTVDLDTDENLALSNPNITLYDMAVMDAVYTMLVNGTLVFTPEMVVRIMSGNFSQDVTSQKRASVVKSLQKLSMIRISIDCTDEFRARKKIGKDETAVLKSYLLPLHEGEVRSANHQSVRWGYQLIEEPVLYTYARTINQIIDVPTGLLEIADASGRRLLSDTDDVIVIKRVIIRRIEAYKNRKNNMSNDIIRYERYDPVAGTPKGLFARLGYQESNYKNAKQWKKKRSSLNKIVTTILEDFSKEKYIAGYDIIREGKQKVVGVRIIL